MSEISRGMFLHLLSRRIPIRSQMTGASMYLLFCFSGKRFLCCVYPIIAQEPPPASTVDAVYQRKYTVSHLLKILNK